jgi:hypothetical protein
MHASMRVSGYSTEEWYWKLPPEDRAKLTDKEVLRRAEKEMFAKGYFVLIPWGTRCVVLDDENNGRGEGSPYKVKIFAGPRSPEVWWVYGFQLDLEDASG